MLDVRENNLSSYKYLSQIVVKSLFISFIILIGLILIIFSYSICKDILYSKNGKATPHLFGAYVVVSQSMVPTIKVNDAIVVKKMNANDYKVGDIITFASSDINYKGLTVTHRIVDKTISDSSQSVYITKGDNNSVVDAASVSADAIYGKVLFKIPGLGHIQHFLSKPSNFFICILVPAFIMLFYDGFRIYSILSKRNVQA